MPKMHVDSAGKLQCPSHPELITHNSPWPTQNGSTNFQDPANGYVIHTEVGYEHTVIQEFNNPADQASAFFSIGVDGHIHQYGPVGHGWKAWTQAGGNPKWRGSEHEDLGHPSNPLTAAQIESSASVLEAVSAHDKFPLQPTDDPNNGKGVIFHSDGGAAWGGHDCPGTVRRGQRGDIIHRAKALRGAAPAPTPDPTPKPSSKVEALQAAVHVKRDGFWGVTTDKAAEAVRHDIHARSVDDCKFEQTHVGTAADGKWGYLSRRARRITINRIQGVLGVPQDGLWGPQTDAAYVAMRRRFHH
jgi:hypothetical protein